MEHENIIKKFIESLNFVLTKVVEKHPNPPSTSSTSTSSSVNKQILKNAVRSTVLNKTGQDQSSIITTDGDVSSDPGAVPPGIILEKNYTVKELANGNQEIKQEDPIETELK